MDRRENEFACRPVDYRKPLRGLPRGSEYTPERARHLLLAPGIKGLSENISVVSIVDRFLEHSRILSVCNGGTTAVFISSADWMPRNLDKRVELFTPIDDPACRTRLIDYLDTCLSDNTNSWRLLPGGEWARNVPASAKKAVRCQRTLYERYNDVIRAAKRGATMFRPHGGREKSPAKKAAARRRGPWQKHWKSPVSTRTRLLTNAFPYCSRRGPGTLNGSDRAVRKNNRRRA